MCGCVWVCGVFGEWVADDKQSRSGLEHPHWLPPYNSLAATWHAQHGLATPTNQHITTPQWIAPLPTGAPAPPPGPPARFGRQPQSVRPPRRAPRTCRAEQGRHQRAFQAAGPSRLHRHVWERCVQPSCPATARGARECGPPNTHPSAAALAAHLPGMAQRPCLPPRQLTTAWARPSGCS